MLAFVVEPIEIWQLVFKDPSLLKSPLIPISPSVQDALFIMFLLDTPESTLDVPTLLCSQSRIQDATFEHSERCPQET